MHRWLSQIHEPGRQRPGFIPTSSALAHSGCTENTARTQGLEQVGEEKVHHRPHQRYEAFTKYIVGSPEVRLGREGRKLCKEQKAREKQDCLNNHIPTKGQVRNYSFERTAVRPAILCTVPTLMAWYKEAFTFPWTTASTVLSHVVSSIQVNIMIYAKKNTWPNSRKKVNRNWCTDHSDIEIIRQKHLNNDDK